MSKLLQRDAVIDKLVSRWESQQRRGRSLSVKQLCKDYPELADEVAGQIGELKRIGDLLATAPGTFSETFRPPISSTASLQERLAAVLGDRFVLEGMLGQGAFGVVYRARDRCLDRPVAVKAIAQYRTTSRFKKEAKALASVASPHVVTIYDSRELPGGLVVLIMELVEGGDLRSAMAASGGKIDEGQVRKWMIDVAYGMMAASDAGIIHRDLKPANILIGRDRRAKIGDFGLAIGATASLAASQSAFVGTPLYIAPEQAENSATVDTRADIYSFGATFYHVLVGAPPFDGESVWSILLKHLQHPPRPAMETVDVSKDISDLLQKCLAKSPNERFQSFGEVLASLDAGNVQQRPLSSLRPNRLWVYKCRLTRSDLIGDWSYFFGDLQGQGRWGGTRSTNNAASLKFIREELQVGDFVLAWQTDAKAAVGLCRITALERDHDETSIILETVTRFEPPVRLLEWKPRSPALAKGKAFIQGKMGTIFETTAEEAREILRICGVRDAATIAPGIPPRRNGLPTAQDFATAFRAIESTITPGQLAMLQAHYRQGTATMPQLADAAGYTLRGANLQYGRMAHRLCDELHYRPSMTLASTGQPVWTAVLGTNPDWEAGVSASQWHWTMYPEVRQALEKLAWLGDGNRAG